MNTSVFLWRHKLSVFLTSVSFGTQLFKYELGSGRGAGKEARRGGLGQERGVLLNWPSRKKEEREREP